MRLISHIHEPTSALSHGVAALFSCAALSVLVVYAALWATPWHVVGFSIFGASLVLLYSASAFYHSVPPSSSWKHALRKFDHSMIYVLIAGTYTPLGLTILRGAWGWSLLGILWGLAFLGIAIKIGNIRIHPALSIFLYIVMGWLGLIAIVPISKSIVFEGLVWLFLGGVFYTVGTIFFGLDRFFKYRRFFTFHDLFHVFTVAGSTSHFWLMIRYVL